MSEIGRVEPDVLSDMQAAEWGMNRFAARAMFINRHWAPAMPEIFEIWQGTAIIYMQERVEQEPGRCFAVTARPPEIVICPPGWGHMVVNGDTQSHMVFGAVCDRSHSGFAYENVKKHKGLAYYPKISGQNTLYWEKNPEYLPSPFIEKTPEKYWFSDILDDGGYTQP